MNELIRKILLKSLQLYSYHYILFLLLSLVKSIKVKIKLIMEDMQIKLEIYQISFIKEIKKEYCLKKFYL